MKLTHQTRIAFIAAVIIAVVGISVGIALPGGSFLRQISPLAAGAVALYGVLCLLNRRWRKVRRLRYAWLILAALFAAAFISVEAVIIVNAHSDFELGEAPPSKYLIVLGAGVNGADPSATLVSRLRTAREYLEQHGELICVVSGGQGANEDISEAEAMKLWLTERGIAPERILMEQESASTAENMRFSLELLRSEYGYVTDTLICSNGYHLFRARWLAERYGTNSYALKAPDYYAYLGTLGYFREFFSVALMWR
ncbi:MAG: YdcF family protein [Clostridiales Family XIII bacterium]|nr:YdcF family protein [Clostridiales Family XIII bacterium]